MKTKAPPPRIDGTRVFLRYPQAEDFEEFAAAARQSRRLHRGLVAPPAEPAAFAAYIAANASEATENLLVGRRADGALVGAVNFSQIFRKAFQSCYLGYYLFAGHTGRGLMTEAVGLGLRYAFRDLGLHRVEANVQPENRASIAVLVRCGFVREGFSRKYLKIGGRWRDHERFAIIREDWRAGRSRK